MSTRARVIIATAAFCFLTAPALADGFIVLHPPRPEVVLEPLAVKFHRVTTTIRDQTATTSVDQVFRNLNAQRLEGTYIFPLPPGAAVSAMSMWIDGEEVAGEMLPREEASRIYTDIVRRMKDPAILEYMGTNMFRMRVFPIEPLGEKRIKIEYTETVPAEAGLLTYRYPLSTEKFSSRPLEEVVISVDLQGSAPVKTIFSPSHEVEVVRRDERAATVGFEQRNVTPNRDFILYYSLSDREFGASLATFRRVGEDGYFSVFITPQYETEAVEVAAKEVVFVVDTSGSMKEPSQRPWKIDQAKAALAVCVKSLGANDRFNIVTFATAVRTFRQRLQPAAPEYVEEALGFIEKIQAGGGTNIQAALETALAQQSASSDAAPRPFMVVFLTDGLPTVGEIQDAAGLAALARKQAGPGTRVFTFGVGYDVDTHLLDTLALENRGDRSYVAPDENIEVKVSGFFEKIANPVLSDVALQVDGIETYDVFPPALPDIFKGSQLVVHGRYRGEGNKALRLTGAVNGKPAAFVYEGTFPLQAGEHTAIPRLWATTKIAYLLDQLRLKGIDVTAGRVPSGPEKELVDEIVSLASQHGVITPYTALLVLEDDKHSSGPASPLVGRARTAAQEAEVRDALEAAPGGLRSASGEAAVTASRELKKLGAGRTDDESAFARAFDAAGTIRRIEDKTFILVDGVWYDSTFREGQATAKIVFLSDAYFDLIAGRPAIARYLSAGARTVVCLGGEAFEIVAE